MTQPHTLPPGWQPTPGDINYAKSRLFCDAQIQDMLANFKHHFCERPKGLKEKRENWSLSWKRWCRTETPWSAWQKENRGHAEPEKVWYERDIPQQDLPEDTARIRNIPKPRVKKIPELGRLGPQGRQRIIDKMAADEPEQPKAKVKPAYVPMPDHLRGTILAPKEVKR